jgi:glucose-6-phosphate isomerase
MLNKLYFDTSKIFDSEKEWLCSKVKSELNTIGYYSLPEESTKDIESFEIAKQFSTIAVIGIGGSSLGAKAVYSFLEPVKELKRELVFFESTDPINIAHLEKGLDIKSTFFVVISKSGTTIETIALFKYFFNKATKEQFCFITDKGSKLEEFAKSIAAKVFYIPNNVGGRFSVLSSVGLVPLHLVGIDIKALLEGAKKVKNSFFNDGYMKDTMLKKALFIAKNYREYNSNVIFAYAENLKYFTEWYIQLWGESLGKRQKDSILNVGFTPIGLIGPKDQHSFLQLIMEGVRDKTVTFIKIKNFERDLSISNITLKNLEELDIINNLKFSHLINMQEESVKEALLEQKDIPVDEIIIDEVSEYTIGTLLFYYELLTSLVAASIDVNTYNQPGVELGKVILKKKLTLL